MTVKSLKNSNIQDTNDDYAEKRKKPVVSYYLGGVYTQ